MSSTMTTTGRGVVAHTPGRLTRRERQIAELAASGLTVEQIGRLSGLPHRTVRTQLYRILPRLGVTTRASVRDALDRLDALHPDDGAPTAHRHRSS
ncbi:helix-turn-helix transcriptional regulator [Streptomyces sp. HUAS MG91]|uniref:Helix-turn-helix transcriptional regulator n=1 Tax=Streptomyces tabacisoli TaxID=3156398 RepID=A0AAU8ILC3_9ACTN